VKTSQRTTIEGNDLSLLSKEQLAAIISLLTDALAVHVDQKAFLQKVVDLACELTFSSGAVAEQIVGDDMVYIGVTHNIADKLGLRLRASSSLSGLCVKEQKMLICEDSESDSRVDTEACRKVGLRSMLVTPLYNDKKIFGVVKVFSRKPDAFDEIDQQILTVAARILSHALVPVWPDE
jgi:L-methionine (R)-S-oxide reductase